MAQRASPGPLRPTSGDPARSLGRLPAPPQGESRRARSESRFRVPDEPVHPNVPTEFASKLSDERHYHEAEALLASQPWRQKPVQTPRTGWQTAQPEELVRRLRHGSPEEQAAAAKKAEGLARREPQQRELLAGAVPAVVMMLAASTPPHASESAAALLRSLASSAELKPAILRAGAVVQLVRLVEERGSSAAQQALDRLSMCDAAVKKQIEWSLSREGPMVLVEAARQAIATASGREAEEIASLAALAADAEDAVQLAAAGGVTLLVQVIATPHADPEATAAAARAVWALAEHAPLRTPVVQAGAIAPLVALLSAATDRGAAMSAAGALCTLARSQAHRQAVLDAGTLGPLLALLNGGGRAVEPDALLDVVRHLAGGTLLPGRS
jgi:hypothetical protein